jgi:UDP-N-acetylmuramoyl-L-alanyl-D-glutamate--2,6-diaminopimelate ligase
MDYQNIHMVTIVGIGGKGAHFIAKFLLLLGIDVVGYDIKKSKSTEELEKLGAKIYYRNPQSEEHFKGDFFLYSNDLPQKIQEIIKQDNADLQSIEIGHFYHQITDDYESGLMTSNEKIAFVKSEIAPLYQIDQSKMRYLAVTGTDGKTSTCTMIYHILKNAGYKPALITTVSCLINDKEMDTGFLHTTTPSSQEIAKIIGIAEEAQCTHMIIESTSHGLEQGRLAGLKFDEIGYTNITSEHLDYHKTWDNYCHAKSLLISKHLRLGGITVLNKDDKSFEVLSKIAHMYQTYSRIENADLASKDIVETEEGLNFQMRYKDNNFKVKLPILGEYNVSNFMCATLLCAQENISIEDCIEFISTFETVRGRMQILQKEPFKVIVDYAHTPNALLEVLGSIRTHKGDEKIIHVFGSAGHRDFYKRPMMGKISNELADITILTAEDPRLESLQDINDQIESGWNEGKNQNGKLIRFDDVGNNVENRRDAIKKGLELAAEGDTVVITGKAHEKSLCFGQVEYPWNDIEETKKLLSNS